MIVTLSINAFHGIISILLTGYGTDSANGGDY